MLSINAITLAELHGVIESCQIPAMESLENIKENIKEVRLRRFSELWKSQFGGNIAAMARALEKSPNQIRFYLHPEKPGGRWMGEDFARFVEHKLQRPRGWLDSEGGEGAPEAAPVPPELQALMASYQSGGPAKQAALTKLAALPEQEMALLLLMLQSVASKYEK